MASGYPQTYDEWRHCITVDCGIELTADYVAQRLEALHSTDDRYTERFIELYGQDYRDQVVRWFEQAADQLEDVNA